MNGAEVMERLSQALPLGAWSEPCAVEGHGAGHACVAVPPDFDVVAFAEEYLIRFFGRGRSLALDGFVDPGVTDRTGAAVLAPYAGRVLSMRAWPYGSGWYGCGTVRDEEGLQRSVVLVAERAPAVEPDGETSWVDRVVAVTGHDGQPALRTDWAAVEARMGTALPGDYRRLVDLFGWGAFDGYLELHVGSGPEGGRDIVRWNDTSRGLAADALCEPYRAFPAPGGLLWWASTEQESRFAWLTDGPDPDRWPVLATDETGEEWDRRDVSTAEYVYRMLTEPDWPFSTAQYFDAHWFLSYEEEQRWRDWSVDRGDADECRWAP